METSFTSRSGQAARLLGVKNSATGKMYFVATPGANPFEFSFPFDCMFEGMEIFSPDANLGDHITRFETRYSLDQGATWLRYKKFSRDWSIFPNDKARIILFPTEPKAGIKLHFDYYNEGTTNVNFSMNLFIMAEDKTVNIMQAEQGEDW